MEIIIIIIVICNIIEINREIKNEVLKSVHGQPSALGTICWYCC